MQVSNFMVNFSIKRQLKNQAQICNYNMENLNKTRTIKYYRFPFIYFNSLPSISQNIAKRLCALKGHDKK